MEGVGGRWVYCGMYAAAFVEHAPLSAQMDGLCSKREDRAHSIVCTVLCLAYSRDSTPMRVHVLLCVCLHCERPLCRHAVRV